MENKLDYSHYSKGSLTMPKYDLLTFRQHKETNKIHLFRSRFDNEDDCKLDSDSLCDESVSFDETDSIGLKCKSEEKALHISTKLHLDNKEICGVCMSRIFARKWKD